MISEARRFALLAGLSIGLVLLHSTSGAHVSSPKNHRMTNDEELQSRSDEHPSNTTTLSASSPDFVIDLLGDEKKFGLKIADKRHRYDQQQAQLVDGPLDQVAASSANQPEESPAPEAPQIEPRNEQEAMQLSEQQQQLADQIIIDHRPSSSDSSSQLDQFGSSTQAPPTSSTGSSLNAPASSQSSSSSSTISPSNQQMGGSSHLATPPGQAQVQWVPAASNQHAIYARQAQPTSSSNSNHQQQFGNMISASNQLISSVQYPTSINSIISDQQQQQPNNQQQTGQFQTQMVNGQQQLVFVPSNLNSQVIGLAPNGRRMSISSWLRGLGSMLSNIFYRRDHGTLSNAQLQAGGMMMQASNLAPSGSWIQLGPNAPHWLTQAQSAIQQFQQQHQQLGLPVSSRLGSLLSVAPQQQAANTMSVTLPQQQLNNLNTFQQQQMGDLQTSGSSNNYATIQAPTSIAAMATNQPFHQQQPQSNLIAQGQTVLVGQLQPATSNGAAGLQNQQQPNSIQVVSVGQQQQQPTASLVAKSNNDQIKQVASTATSGQSQSSASQSSTGTTQTRFSRSSKQQTQVQQQHQQQTSTPSSQTTNGNLPLAHYSHYSASD